MPDSIDLARYSVFVPPDPFEDHTGPFYFKNGTYGCQATMCRANFRNITLWKK